MDVAVLPFKRRHLGHNDGLWWRIGWEALELHQSRCHRGICRWSNHAFSTQVRGRRELCLSQFYAISIADYFIVEHRGIQA